MPCSPGAPFGRVPFSICQNFQRDTCVKVCPLLGGKFVRERQRGVENSGEGKTYHKAPPQKRFWTPPPTYDTPSPLFVHALRSGNGHRPHQSHFVRPPKLVLEGALYSMFPPPKSHDTFYLPFAVSQILFCRYTPPICIQMRLQLLCVSQCSCQSVRVRSLCKAPNWLREDFVQGQMG